MEGEAMTEVNMAKTQRSLDCRTSIQDDSKLLRENQTSVPEESQNSSFIALSENSVLEKGVLIHILEDPNVARQMHEGPSAVLINVPTEANAVNDDVFSFASVTVSLQYLATIPETEDRATFFHNLCAPMDIKVTINFNNVTLHGSWNEILLVQATMRSYMASWKQETLMKEEHAIAESDQQTSSTSPVRTRHQGRQKEKAQGKHRPKIEPDVNEEENTKTPRENKENEVHVSISMAESNPCPQIGDNLEEQEICIIPTSSAGQSFNTKKHRGPKKNYELLAPYKFFCTMCSFKTKRESHYHRHVERHETISCIYHCDSCNFSTIRLGHLRRHELTHSTSMLSCSICSYHTDDMRHLTRHLRAKHPEQPRTMEEEKPVEVLSCNKCSYSTTKMYLFQRHLKVHNAGSHRQKQETLSFQCEECPYKTKRKEHYLRHVNNVHQNRRPYLCDFCGKAFKRPDALKQHGITHAELDPTVAVFRCSVCNKGCRSQAHLNEHLAVHSNVRSFLCEICGLSFKTRSVQRKHVLTIHKNPHAYSCNRCLKRFNTKYALRRHMKQHSWKDEEDCGITAHTVVIQTSETSNSEPPNNALTVQVPEEILASLPAGAVAVPLFSVMPQTSKKDAESSSDGLAAAEVLALQLKQMQTCSESPSESTNNQGEESFLTSSAEQTSGGLLYVTTNFEQF